VDSLITTGSSAAPWPDPPPTTEPKRAAVDLLTVGVGLAFESGGHLHPHLALVSFVAVDSFGPMVDRSAKSSIRASDSVGVQRDQIDAR